MTINGNTTAALSQTPPAAAPLDVERIRADFPILQTEVYGKPLAFLDNAASVQKPQPVIDSFNQTYENCYANIHRGVYRLSEETTQAFDGAREKLRGFINARDARELIFVRNATEGINLVAQSYGRANLQAGDEILITHMEHHANIVPWQMLCEQTGAQLKVAPIDDNGELIWDEFEALLSERTKIVSVVYISNSLGTINPVKAVVDAAHAHGAVALIDAAQAAPHAPLDVQHLDCDFMVFSGHKMYGPTGVGVLYGKQEWLEAMPPYQGGGDMILSVSFEKTVYNEIPQKFEAGTPDIAGAIALGVAVDYLQSIGLDRIAAYEHELLEYGTARLTEIPELRLIGTAKEKASILSFVIDGVHPHDLGTILDRQAIAVRTGHHCTQPLMERFSVPATSRASFAFYNKREEIDRLVEGIQKGLRLLL